MTDIRKRKRLELERLQAERQRPQYRILRPVITRRAKETVITSDVSSSSDSKMPRRSFNQNWNNGSACSAIDPVSSSSSGCYCKIAIFEGAKRMVNAYEKKKLRERFNGSDTDDSD